MAPLYDRDYDYLSPYTSSLRTRDRYHDASTLLDPSLDAMGDFVTRRLVPVMLHRSERPLQLVMNYGTLRLSDDHTTRRGSTGVGANAVIYNAPGSVMTMGAGGATSYTASSGTARRPSLLSGGEAERATGHALARGRKVSICEGCLKRQLVGASGYCLDCELVTRDRSAGLGLDGIRYGYGRTPEFERADESDLERTRARKRKIMERERERERLLGGFERETPRERENTLRELEERRLKDLRERRLRRERERETRGARLGGYHSDLEREELRFASDREGGRYYGERW